LGDLPFLEAPIYYIIANQPDTLQKNKFFSGERLDIPIDTKRLVRISLYPSKIDLYIYIIYIPLRNHHINVTSTDTSLGLHHDDKLQGALASSRTWPAATPRKCWANKTITIQDGAPKIAKLVYKWLNNGLW